MREGRNGGKLKNGGNNGGGRPKKLPALDNLLADVLGEEKDGMTAAEAILKKLRQEATKGNLRAAEILLNRAYGMPKQKTELSGPEGGAVETVIRFVDDSQDEKYFENQGKI